MTPFTPFFLPAERGERFCLFHPSVGPPRGAIVYLHPFAEEMNKSRRMAALQSRAFAAHGYAVLQIDLCGCGESPQAFGSARWDLWKADAALAVAWLSKHAEGPVYVWGLRLGALLALDYAKDAPQRLSGLLLWQPVLSGEQMITQFLRLRATRAMLTGGAAGPRGTAGLRAALAAGKAVEVAGYELAPELAHSIEALRIAELAPKAVPVRWMEVVSGQNAALPSPSGRVVERWRSLGLEVEACAVRGEPFWNSVEISECPELLAQATGSMACVEA